MAASYHIVSSWYTIDWIGWKVIEWDLSDPDQVGSWLGDGKLDGNLRFDSIQITHPVNGSLHDTIYTDDSYILKKHYVLKLIMIRGKYQLNTP